MKLLHLYYDLMNLYGEYGNLKVLKKHLEDQGEEVEICQKTINDEIDFNDYDLVYCGAGMESRKHLALEDLKKRKAELEDYISNDGMILLTGNAMEFMGDLGLIDLKYEETKNRYVGDVIAESEEFGTVVGFINRCTKVTVPEEMALFDLKLMFSDGKKYPTGKEGYHFKNVYGTYITGPILTKNPAMIRSFVQMLLKEKPYKDVAYPYEDDIYQVTLKALSDIAK